MKMLTEAHKEYVNGRYLPYETEQWFKDRLVAFDYQTSGADYSINEANFRVILDRLGTELDNYAMSTPLGQRRILFVRKDNKNAISKLKEFKKRLKSYPILDDDILREVHDEMVNSYWENCSRVEKIELISISYGEEYARDVDSKNIDLLVDYKTYDLILNEVIS